MLTWGWAGYTVLAIDYFEGDSYGFHVDEKGFDVQAWIKEKQARTAVLLPPWVEAVRAQYGERGVSSVRAERDLKREATPL